MEDLDFIEDSEFKAEQEKAERAGRELRAKIRNTFETDDGKATLNYILYELCGLGKSVFDESGMVMARRAGAQEVGIFLKAITD